MTEILLQEPSPELVKIVFSNKEGKYNLVDLKFMHDFIDTLKKLDREKKIRYVIIKGDKNFGAGADIAELKRASENREYASTFFSTMFEMYRTLFTFGKPIIANVEGIAYGASFEILLGVDFIVASPYARFGAPGGKIGVFPPVLITIGKEILGWSYVRKLAMLGEEISADEAYKIGLVYEVTDNFDESNLKLIQKLKQMAPSSLTTMRNIIFRNYEKDLEFAFSQLTDQVVTEEANVGIYAFLTKIKPRWSI